MPVSLPDFIEQATIIGLVSTQDLNAVINSPTVSDRPRDAEQLARQLVKQQLLTPFQAQQLYQGKGNFLVVGNYLLLDKLGEGGMAAVFKARHRTMNRIVAIKILPRTESKNPESVKRFQREAEAAARLKHPNIVAAYDADESDGTHYLVMEYIDGVDLGTLVERQGPVPVEQAVSYVVQAARGLAYSHKCGVIHRDIKPSNLVLDSQGMVRVLDMGIARIESSGEQDKLTKTGYVVGTVDFVAPEQAVDTRSADARADIYSLGVTLWYLLTGRLLYDGTSMVMKLLAHQNNPIPSLRDACPEVSPQLEDVFTRMVAKDPADRYQSMPEVLAALLGNDVKTAPPAGGGTSVAIADSETYALIAEDDEETNDDSVVDSQEVEWLDEVLEKPAKSKSRPPKSPSSASTPEDDRVPIWLNPWVWTGAGVFGLVSLLGFIVFVEFRNRDSGLSTNTFGSESNTVAVPKSDTATGEFSGSNEPNSTGRLSSQRELAAEQDETTVPQIANIEFVTIRPGTFSMGSSDPGAQPDEKPRPVTISRPFYVGKYEVTVGQVLQWLNAPGQAIEKDWVTDGGDYSPVKKSGSRWVLNTVSKFGQTDRQPMVSISWDGARAFCEWCSAQDSNYRYRLPTEAEWEYMARAGSTTPFPWGNSCNWTEANIDGSEPYGTKRTGPSQSVTLPVGSYAPNAWGIYDTVGNVWEWCEDLHDSTGASRICRGGAWTYGALLARSSFRHNCEPWSRGSSIGFRVVAEALVATTAALNNFDSRLPSVPTPHLPDSPSLQSSDDLASRLPSDTFNQPVMEQPIKSKNVAIPESPLEITNSIGMKLRLIPAGEFLMGSPDGNGSEHEHPQHLVRITRPYYVGKYEVTIREVLQWLNAPEVTIDDTWVTNGGGYSPVKKSKGFWVLNTAGKFDQSASQPMQHISWYAAIAFCEWLGRQEGRTYRLPTEAEWEYMARAGSTTAYPWSDSCSRQEANISGQDPPGTVAIGPYRNVTNTVGSFSPNAWGLHDTVGNVSEWCGDWYDAGYYSTSPTNNPQGPTSGSSRVCRGGSWTNGPILARSSSRDHHSPNDRYSVIGFRVVCELPEPAGTSSTEVVHPPMTAIAPAGNPRQPTMQPPSTSSQAPLSEPPLEFTNSIGMKFRRIPAGEFLMGSDSARRSPESPQHKVTMTRPFYMGVYEVTKGQFADFVKEMAYVTLAEPTSQKREEHIWGAGYDEVANRLVPKSSAYSWKKTGFAQTEDHPVVNIAWIDAVAFCEWLSEKEAAPYRLPTEAEWEYACRAGTTGAYQCGNNAESLAKVGNIADRAFNRLKPDGRFGSIQTDDGHVFTAAVGQYEPNSFGLYDLHGNVWEWCGDWYSADYYFAREEHDPVGPVTGSQRVLRGGSWLSTKVEARSAHRFPKESSYRDASIGFRVVRELDPK